MGICVVCMRDRTMLAQAQGCSKAGMELEMCSLYNRNGHAGISGMWHYLIQSGRPAE